MTTELSEQKRKAYEQYLLATSEEDKQDSIKKLIPGSQPYYYLYFIDLFKRVGSKLSEQDKILLHQFTTKYPFDEHKKSIEARLLLLSYDDAGNEEEKQKIIGEIKGHFT